MDKRDKFKLKGNTIAGTFRVDEVVAEGGFGIVYRAFHLHFRSPVALKCLKIPGELTGDERQLFLEQFRSEAEIQFRLSAALPHIVRPLHVDAIQTEDGDFIPMMALEWLEGLSFETIIEQRAFSELPPMPLQEAMDLIGPAAEALHQAHNFESGDEKLAVIHRDIKPDNLFLTELNGKKIVKILDFGISKVRRAANQLAGHFSQTAGTAPFSPAYGAPEQWVPKRFGQTGPWTDVWGLALTLVEIIKGDAVIVGDHQAMMGTALDPKVRPTPRSEGVTVSDEVESVFLKALSLDPRFRYQSVEAFWQALQAAVYLSGSGAHSYDETPSGSRIALPPMSAPTPWKSPADRGAILDPIGALPPMLAPAPMEPTTGADLEFAPEAAFYPLDPLSDLKPVPAAPTNWTHFDPEVPPSSGSPEHFEGPPHDVAERARVEEMVPALADDFIPSSSEPVPLSNEPVFSADDFSARGEPSLKLELESTSTFPQTFERRSFPRVETTSDSDANLERRSSLPPALGSAQSPVQRPARTTSSAPPGSHSDRTSGIQLPSPRPLPPSSRRAADGQSAGAKQQNLPAERPRRSPPPERKVQQKPAPAGHHIPDLTPTSGAADAHGARARSIPPPPPKRASTKVAESTSKGPPPPPVRSKRPAVPPRANAGSKAGEKLSLIPTNKGRRSAG